MISSTSRKLTVIVDVSCDYTNAANPIAIHNAGTIFEKTVNHIIIDASNPFH